MEFILGMQSALSGPFWDSFWYRASKLYSEDVLLALLPVAYWVSDRSFARFLATLFVLQAWLNVLFKGAVGSPRPPEAPGLRIVLIDTDGRYSMPSGHAQGAAAIATAVASRRRRPWITALAVLLPFLVGMSRVYYGMHWPADVPVGWALGFALAWGGARAWPAVTPRLDALPLGLRLALGLGAPVLMLLTWERLPFVARIGLQHQYPALGALAGLWFGTLLEEKYLRFDPRGSMGWHVLKCVVGLGLVLGVRYGLKAVLPEGDWFVFVRYVGIGLTVTVVAPWLFARLPGRPAARIHPAA